MISLFGLILAVCLPKVAEMSLEEKVGQILVAHFSGEEVNNEAEFLLNQVHVGGIIYYNWANGLKSPEQIQKLSNGLQRLSKIPLFISVDQEGGRYSRFQEGFTQFCGNGVLGLLGESVFAEQCAFAMGEELRAVGVNLNFAPVVDVHSGVRSFGKSPELVALFGERALHGFHQAGILTTLKHFPGIGGTTVDSHLDLPVLDKSIDDLWEVELHPYKELVQMTDFVMTAHLLVPVLDPVHCATLSSAILEDLLRGQLEFRGLIISDSLIMEGLLKQVASIEEAAIRAFEAGCDLLCLGGKRLLGMQDGFELTVRDVARIHSALVEAVQSGRISEERLGTSLERILRIKKTLSTEELSEEEIHAHVATEEHLRLAKRVLRCAKPQQPIE